MNILPAMDLMNGQCVRLLRGDFAEVTQYSNDPVEMACRFEQQGARWLHLVDLDGAQQGKSAQYRKINAICRATTLMVQVGGGIREQAQIEALLDAGVTRVVLGSLAVTDPTLVQSLLGHYGPEKIVLAVDVRDQQVVINGWQQTSPYSITQLLALYPSIRYVLCTDVERDGALLGPNVSLYQSCLEQFPQINWLASGGVSGLSDVKALTKLKLSGVIIGKALYENRINLSEVLAC